jgi:hypothetical protein
VYVFLMRYAFGQGMVKVYVKNTDSF